MQGRSLRIEVPLLLFLFGTGITPDSEFLRRELRFDGLELLAFEAFFVLSDGEPLRGHFFDLGRIFGSEVVEFGAVIGEVVEFPFTSLGGGDFPVAGAEGTVGGVVEVERVVWCRLGTLENEGEGLAFEGIDDSVCDFALILGTGEFEEGGEEVDEMGRLIGDGPRGGLLTRWVSLGLFKREVSGKLGDHGGGDATLVLVLFIETERGVSDRGPADVVAPVGLGIPGLFFFAAGAVEGAGTVVGAEEDGGVLVEARCFKMGDEAADVLIKDVDHGGVDFHAVFFPLFLFGSERVPGGDVGGAGGELPFGGEEAGRDLFFVATFPEDVPAFAIFAVVFFDGGFGGLERVVGGVVGAVEEEGFWGVGSF